MKKTLLASSVVAALSMLTGCGGGSPSNSNIPTAADIVITSSNSTKVAAGAADTATNSGSSVSPIGAEITSNANTTPTGMDKIVTDLLTMQTTINQGQVPVGTEISGNGYCMGDPNAGTKSWSGQVANPSLNPISYPNDGDSVTYQYNNCMINQQTSTGYSRETRYTGQMTETVVSHTNNTRTFTLVFSNLNTTTTQTINGVTSTLQTASFPNMSMTLTATGGLVTGWFNIAQLVMNSTGTFSLTSNGVTRTRALNQLQETFRMNQFALDGTYSQNNSTKEHTINGLMSVDRMGGAANIATVTPFISSNTYSSTYPNVGIATIKGKTGTIRITAQSDATNVFIELDANDDGTYESSQTMTWTALLASM